MALESTENRREKTRGLFFSSMTVTPTTGGGTFVFNSLEPAPRDAEIFYSTPVGHAKHMTPFPETSRRARSFLGDEGMLLPGLREGGARKVLRAAKETLGLDALAVRLHARGMAPPILARVTEHVEELRPDVLLACPQPLRDVIVASEVAERFDLPLVVWFMDDYYKDRFSEAWVRRLWNQAQRRFVSSDAMRKRFSEKYGGDCEVLLTPVHHTQNYSEPEDRSDQRLRIAYAGTVNFYYADTVRRVLSGLRGLGDRVLLDVYTFDDLTGVVSRKDADDPVWHRRIPVRQEDLSGQLKGYDVLLLLSSFRRRHREIAETAQAGKLADYLAAGRCILAYGPPYAENVRYIERHGIGETVTSDEPGALRNAVLDLARDPRRQRHLGEAAYLFGREHRDRAKNRDRLWRALLDAAESRS